MSASILLVLALFGLSACTSYPSSGSLQSSAPGYQGMPTAQGIPLTVRGSDTVQARAIEGSLFITTLGPSSCPIIPEVDDVDSEDELVRITLTGDFAGPCTADEKPRTFEFAIDGDLVGFVVEVTVDY
ncbi:MULTISPECIES: hypothetical protein [unclassified Microbacterium]|uniref:hypothetical protein n=1 Tax=unclassified Microbacterium TaxID=2609290 RepID=UPI003017FF21